MEEFDFKNLNEKDMTNVLTLFKNEITLFKNEISILKREIVLIHQNQQQLQDRVHELESIEDLERNESTGTQSYEKTLDSLFERFVPNSKNKETDIFPPKQDIDGEGLANLPKGELVDTALKRLELDKRLQELKELERLQKLKELGLGSIKVFSKPKLGEPGSSENPIFLVPKRKLNNTLIETKNVLSNNINKDNINKDKLTEDVEENLEDNQEDDDYDDNEEEDDNDYDNDNEDGNEEEEEDDLNEFSDNSTSKKCSKQIFQTSSIQKIQKESVLFYPDITSSSIKIELQVESKKKSEDIRNRKAAHAKAKRACNKKDLKWNGNGFCLYRKSMLESGFEVSEKTIRGGTILNPHPKKKRRMNVIEEWLDTGPGGCGETFSDLLDFIVK
jgi:hypothetical protein